VDLALNGNGIGSRVSSGETNGNGNGDHAIGSLDDLIEHPALARSMTAAQLAAIAQRLAALQSTIAALQFTAALALDSIPLQGHAAADDARTTVAIEVVMRDLGVSRRWLFAHADRPGYRWIVRISRKRLAVLEAGYHRYLTSRPRA